MAPVSSRQIFVWTLPTLFLLSYLWYKRKKSALRSDPGGTDRNTQLADEESISITNIDSSKVIVQNKPIPESIEENIRVNLISTIKSEIAIVGSDEVCEADICLISSKSTEVKSEIVDILHSSTEKVIEIEFDSLISSTTDDIDENIESGIIEISVNRSTAESICTPDFESEGFEGIVDDKSNNTTKVTENLKSQLNPEAKDFIVQNLDNQSSIYNIVEHTNIIEKQTGAFDTPTSSLSTFECTEAATVESTKEDQASNDYSNTSVEVFEKPAIKLDSTSELNQTWAAECELELGEVPAVIPHLVEDIGSLKPVGTMARELSSDVPLEGTVSEEDCTSRKLHTDGLSLESKLSTLELDDGDVKSTITNKVLLAKERNGIERDSANHSPAEVMLGSPSISNCSDAHSEGSSDSGKGCSDVATPPSRTPASGSSVAGDLPTSSVYEFVLPQLLVGRLIGRHGVFVHQIKTKTLANILIKRHPDTAKLKICAIEGTQMDIDNALEMIRQKFPIKRYPNVTLDQVSFLAPVTTCPLLPESFQLQLIEGVNNDVILSSLVSPAHFFLQQPTHPTYPSLNRLNMCMNYCYNEPLAPVLPMPVESSVICVAPTMGGWYRAQVMSSDSVNETSDVKFIDYGGFQTVENSMLRQIRSDFINLPFQAAECYLANVKPKDGVWPAEAMAFVEQLTHGQVIQAQIYGYAEDGIPVVFLFSYQGSQVLVVNRELVTRGYADWDEPTEVDVTTLSTDA